MRWAGRTCGRGLGRAVVAAMLLVAVTVTPSVAVASGGARAVTGARADDTPGPSAPAESPTDPDPQPDPQPTDTVTDDPPPPPPPADPSLTAPGEPVEPGESFTVTGADFDCSEGEGLAGPLNLSVDGQQPVNLTVDDSGGFEYTVTVPTDAAPGQYGMSAVCTAVPGAPVVKTVYDTNEPSHPAPDPQISLSADSGPPERQLTVTGEGFLCDDGAGVDVLWDGETAVGGTPDADGHFTVALSVPSSAAEGEHDVTASCDSPQAVQDSRTFTVDTVPVTGPPDGPSDDPHDVTIHLTDYPAACTRGAIVIGGRRLDTWLDDGSTEGDAGAGLWEFIDLHAHLPGEMKGRHDVQLDCPGRDREKAGVIILPSPDPLAVFELPLGSTVHPEGKTGEITPTSSGGTDGGGSDGGGSDGGDSGGGGGGKGGGNGGGSGSGGGTGHHPVPGLADALRTPADVSWALKDLAGSAAMAAWFMLLVLLLERAFPNQIADNAIARWWRRLRKKREERMRREGRTEREARLPGWVRMCAYSLLGGSMAVWADARTHWSPPTAGKTLGAAASMLIVLVTYEKTKDSLTHPRGNGVRSELRVVPVGLLLAALMTAMSRLLEFPVPYVYGLIAVYIVFSARGDGPDDPGSAMPKGQAILIGGICVLAAAVLVWVLGAPLVQHVQAKHSPPGSLPYMLAYAVGLAVVAGIEVVVFGLLPLSGMDGHALKEWNKPAWYALYLTGLTFFFHVLLNSLHPAVGNRLAVDEDLRWWTLGIATALFLAAWAFSLALRWLVARDERRAPPA
ncbi:FGLLP motif-containing membrane protein [Streptomyces sp. NPDC046915]|uniref:FGLLP motif-containing membrane protein n=1 Tax=Streptomyces sp. NPDC046915 TaxID=3155257 RepID=UPI0033D9B923